MKEKGIYIGLYILSLIYTRLNEIERTKKCLN